MSSLTYLKGVNDDDDNNNNNYNYNIDNNNDTIIINNNNNNNNNVIYFDSFGVEHIPKKIKAFINRTSHNKNIITNIFRLNAYNSIMCGYFCIGFIDFVLKGKTLTQYTNLFSSNNFKKNDDIILNYFMSNI